MYKPEREQYYKKLLSIYDIPKDTVTAKLNGKPIYIDTYSRLYYNIEGQAIGQFRH